MIEAIILVIGLIILAIASAIDIKDRWVPDYLSFFLLAFGVYSGIIISLNSGNWSALVSVLITTSILFSVGYMLYRLGMWGGGDAKLVAGLGAIFALQPAIFVWPFTASFLINSFFFGAVIGIVWMLAVAWKIRKDLKLKNYELAISLIGGAGAIIFGIAFIIYAWFIALLVFTIFVLVSTFGIIMAIDRTGMVKKVKINKLVEGDWLVNDLDIESVIIKKQGIGLTTSDLKKLNQLEASGKLSTILIKDGVPYVPSFFLAAVLAALGIDLLQSFLLLMVSWV